jgi:hypothetical protein
VAEATWVCTHCGLENAWTLVPECVRCLTWPSLAQQDRRALALIEAREDEPFCRDCADENGTCPADGLPCDRDSSPLPASDPSTPEGASHE